MIEPLNPYFLNGYTINPDEYYRPSFRISPFKTSDIAENLSLNLRKKNIEVLNDRIQNKKWCITYNGKSAISIAINALNLNKDSCITILTTSNNYYISSCVTKEIEKFCSWSRQFEKNTSAIFVNHEFGYPYRDLIGLQKYGLPIIEDACHSYLSNTQYGNMGHVGDFVIFSLPKVFPIQLGGLLYYDEEKYSVKSSIELNYNANDYILKVLSNYLNQCDTFRKTRLENYFELVSLFEEIGCTPRFDLLDFDVPGVFMFNTPPNVDLNKMKLHGWRNGIECSVFYGENSFFIPVHHRLKDIELKYFFDVFSYFMKDC